MIGIREADNVQTQVLVRIVAFLSRRGPGQMNAG
jgi:hypothetical protein